MLSGGFLCPKAAALGELHDDPDRLRAPLVRRAGRLVEVGWDEAFDRIARLMKDDRDRNFAAAGADGKPVHRWLSTGSLAASAPGNETGYLTHKFVRSLGILAFDNQARV